jgi:hypothetical protein
VKTGHVKILAEDKKCFIDALDKKLLSQFDFLSKIFLYEMRRELNQGQSMMSRKTKTNG